MIEYKSTEYPRHITPKHLSRHRIKLVLLDGTEVSEDFLYPCDPTLKEFNRVENPVGVRIYRGSYRGSESHIFYPWHQIKQCFHDVEFIGEV